MRGGAYLRDTTVIMPDWSMENWCWVRAFVCVTRIFLTSYCCKFTSDELVLFQVLRA